MNMNGPIAACYCALDASITHPIKIKIKSELRLLNPQLRQPIDNRLRLPLDPPHQHLTRRTVVDQAHGHADAPDAVVGVPGLVHHLPARAGDELADVLELGAARPPLERDDLRRDRVLEHARRVVQRAEDVRRVEL